MSEAGADGVGAGGQPKRDALSAANEEAAKRRNQLREAEAERDALREKLTAMQKREVTRMASERLDSPDDLFDIGKANFEEFISDDGELDTSKVSMAIATLLKSRPNLAKRAIPSFDGGDVGNSIAAPEKSYGEQMQYVLRGR